MTTKTPASHRPLAWKPLVGAVMVGAVIAGVIAWQLNLQSLDRQASATRAGLKKLGLSRGIPPNQAVMDYLRGRQAALEQRLQSWIGLVTTPPMAEAAADPQLYFQEQLHEVQRLFERSAAARSITPPQQLGFPKELPPAETVPRLLVQLSLMKELAAILFQPGVTSLTSYKVEDPETIPEAEGDAAFLMRVPVRVRLTTTLPPLLKILADIERVKPLIELRAIRLTTGATPETLEVELTLARYLLQSGSTAGKRDETPAPSSRVSTKRKKGR